MKNVLFLIVFASFNLSAKVVINEETENYLVTPSANQSLKSALDEASPIIERGSVFYGRTRYIINWNYWWTEKGNHCVLTKVRVKLNLFYTLPSMPTEKRQVMIAWPKWFASLLKHEQGHALLAKNAASEIDQTLSSIPLATRCDKLEKNANNAANQIMKKLKQENINYDEQTLHGKTQGAWL